MKHKIAWTLLVVGLFPSFSRMAAGQQYGEATTVCALAESPKRFDGHTVRLHAYYENDGRGHAVLMERGCLSVAMTVEIPDGRPGAAELKQAVNQGWVGTIDKTIMATFVGVFQFHPDAYPARKLVVNEVREIDVRRKSIDDPVQVR